MTSLLEAVRAHAVAHAVTHAGAAGVATTPIPGLMTLTSLAPTEIAHDILRPLVCLVVQGGKHVTQGGRDFAFSAGDSLIITADVPVASRITEASPARPYYSLVLELDLGLVTELSAEMAAARIADPAPVRAEPTDAEVSAAALRLLRLLDRPQALPVLRDQMLRELHYWLLAGRHGSAIRQLGWPDGHAQRVARAVAILRAEFARPVPVARLAAAAGMSLSTFHQHFRAVTTLSPLQFQKQLRLIEARRLMLQEGAAAAGAAFAVGYESVPQFTREYGRMFGLSPARDVKAARDRGGPDETRAVA
ncbi:AraC family transcriptional regulator [Xanthobacter tagetidis]|uniref:AraC family transcriptional regulator n=1 Tax=Xanthobacter tagetidis TaxID=60216 RepID=A0A3L7AHX6_9HYPH|nr:AraC family transcriptional regulator [Xanthobacter tagetidis]MBB6306292.1 AraC-like DNA-binding protein [Xanthobacter tagetidis]RLP79565.1 AraC family transcriptional regulator [Xanthobacter tagetidis]